MSKCVLVLSVGRSGSSAVAGMLNELGVDMGAGFLGGDRNNPYGTFEDLAFVNVSRAILTGKEEPGALKEVIRDSPLWGVKDPQLCLTVGHLLPYLHEAGVDVSIIYVIRNPDAVIDSYYRAYYSGMNVARNWYETTLDALEKNLARYEGPLLTIHWEDVKMDPVRAATKLAKFVDSGDHADVLNAASHIRQKPKKKGWGSVALGVRIAKHPEPSFFTSWTTLLTGGVMSQDTVLMPQAHMSAHWASNALTKNFLHTDKDSLLFLDDDMTFSGDALHTLRSNEDNWGYDIVSGFATHRVWPPKPIIMQLKSEQPPEPESLKGDSFNLVKEPEDGAVIPVDAVGLAFTLVKRHVFEAMIHPDHGVDYTWFFSFGPGMESDDIPFCRRARELGFTMAVDMNVKLGHVGYQHWGWDDFQTWMAAEQKGAQVDFDSNDLVPILESVASSDNGMSAQAVKLLEAIRGA